MEPLVSIIVVSYNNLKFIPQCLDSVLGQTYKNTEIIFADDYSTDGSREKLLEYYEKYPNKIKLSFHGKNEGLSKNLNDAIKLTSGKYISHISTDDWWTEKFIEKEVEILENNPEIGFCHSKVFIFNDEKKIIEKESEGIATEGKENIFFKLMNGPFINALTVMIRKDILEKTGLFDESIYFLNDYDMWLRISIYYNSYYINEPLAYYRIHQDCFTIKEQAKGKNAISNKEYSRMIQKNVNLYFENHPDANKTILVKYLHLSAKHSLHYKYYKESIRIEYELIKKFKFVPIVWIKLPIFIIKMIARVFIPEK